MSRFVLLLVSTACLAACGGGSTSPQHAALAPAPVIPANAAQKVNGVYKGAAFPVTVGSPICPTATWGTVEIGDQTLYFAFTPQTIFIAPIQPDGTVRMVLPDGTLAGGLTDGRLLFSVKNRVCESSFDLHRVM